jgi:mannose-1-phosphate guanylyltransferase
MPADYALILSAGKGKRMGRHGEISPKPMWPIFERKLIDLQINYVRDLGIKNIFVNTHHLADQIISYLAKAHSDVKVLNEVVLLDIGGAIHNLADKINYQGSLLVINSDQFLIFSKAEQEKIKNYLNSSDNILFTISFTHEMGYNALVSQNEYYDSVRKNDTLEEATEYQTYSGMSLIQLSSLERQSGVSGFFESICIPQNFFKLIMLQNYEYWDFGTLERYQKSLFKCIELGQRSLFYHFLMKHEAINTSKWLNGEYQSNLTDKFN